MFRSFLIVALAVALVSPISAAEGPEKALADDNNTFAVQLYEQILEDGDNAEKNLFFSPFSISSAFGMAYAGARGQTAQQMKDVLHFQMEDKTLHKAYKTLLTHLNTIQENSNTELNVANALWGQKDYGFRKQYLTMTRNNYGAGLKQVNFKKDSGAARGRINSWVSEKTNDKIKKLMPRGSITPMTRLVLTNAIYFKARWASVFKKKATDDKPFKLLSGKTIEAPTMHQTDQFGYNETQEAKILQMPYKKHQLSMYVILPRADDGLPNLEKGLTADRVNSMLDTMSRTKVKVAMPKFKLKSKYMLGDVLKRMGMTDAFDGQKADFTGMSTKEELFIQAVVHQAYVDVYEEGTEAAAATGISVGATSVMPAKPKTFHADHPFLFLIRDRQTGSILFMGRVINPAQNQ